MSDYTQQGWATGQVINETKLRNMDQGIDDAHTEIADGIKEVAGYGVYSGGRVTAQDPAAMAVDIAAVTGYLQNGNRYNLDATSQTIDAADATNARKDLIYITTAGALAYAAGTPAASPTVPEPADEDHPLAIIDVPAGDTAIEQAQITDRRQFNRKLGGATGAGNSEAAFLKSLLAAWDTYSLVATAHNANNKPTTLEYRDGSNVVATISVTYNASDKPTQIDVTAGGETMRYTITWTDDRFDQYTKAVI